MAKYTVLFGSEVGVVEAATKAAVIKQCRDGHFPNLSLKEAAKFFVIEKVKVVKETRLKCAICEEAVTRKEFVDHVRRH